MSRYTPEEKVKLARHPDRPGTADFIQALFTDFFEQRGDRLCREDGSILGGIARFHGRPVTVVGHRKGRSLEENLTCNFGMPGPEGYRKAQRLMRQAEKFGRPIITFVDTPGAYPGKEAEERGQGEAIAQCLALMSALEVPVISVITGEGNSGGALALAAANRVLRPLPRGVRLHPLEGRLPQRGGLRRDEAHRPGPAPGRHRSGRSAGARGGRPHKLGGRLPHGGRRPGEGAGRA